ncbi:MAG: STAS domain-containing protein [Caulobacteraceae bacterium]
MPISLELAGDLSIRGIDAAYGLLAEAFKDDGDLLISVSADAAIDLTLVQLMEAGRKAARESGRGFRLAAPASGALLETLGRGGFLESPGDRDFWLSQSGN